MLVNCFAVSARPVRSHGWLGSAHIHL